MVVQNKKEKVIKKVVRIHLYRRKRWYKKEKVDENGLFIKDLRTFFNNLSSSDRQFRFKKPSDCNKAINLVKNTFHFFNANGNTVNLGFVDIKSFRQS